MPHDQDTIASFQRGEKRLIFGRPINGGELVMLPDGEAHAWKARTKAELRCPIPGCSDPELRAIARFPRKRDGFSHLPNAGGHGAESFFHLEAKARIAQWLRARHPDCTVVEEQPSNAQWERVADVMITNPTGGRVAFEIQYAAITPVELERRHRSYEKQGIMPIWPFGHTGAQLARYRREDGTVALTPTHEWMGNSGVPVFWFNPFSLEVAVATTGIVEAGKQFDVFATERKGTLAVEPLDAFSLRRSGFGSDFTRQLTANRHEAERRVEEARTREEARVKRIEQIAARREIERTRTLQVARAEWASSELRQRILTHFDGAVPSWLKAPIGGKLPVVASAWQSALFERFILGKSEDSVLSLAGCVEALAGIVPAPREIRESIAAAWLIQVAKAGQITPMAACNWWSGSDRQKFIVITHARPKARNEARLPQPKVAAIQPASAVEIDANRVAPIGPLTSPSYAPRLESMPKKPQVHVPKKSAPKCRICQDPLDPIYVEDGVHTICTRMGRR